MAITLREKIAQLDPEQQEEIKAEAERLHAEYLSLRELRKARDLTQVQLAEILGHNQVSVAKLEQRTDLLLSTLRRYVEAMGGKLDLVVTLPDRPPLYLEGIGELDDPAPRAARRTGKHGENARHQRSTSRKRNEAAK